MMDAFGGKSFLDSNNKSIIDPFGGNMLRVESKDSTCRCNSVMVVLGLGATKNRSRIGGKDSLENSIKIMICEFGGNRLRAGSNNYAHRRKSMMGVFR